MMHEMMNMAEVHQTIYRHALAHYDENGWDFYVECFNVNELISTLNDIRWTMLDGTAITTPELVFKGIEETVGLWAMRRNDVRSEAF
jgi:hypothetical protein